jgi:hypothetical protein
MLVRFVLVILVIGAIAFCVYRYRVELGLVHPATSQESANPEQASSDLHPAHILWQTLDRSPDGFKVEMPEGTRQTQIPAYDERGNVDQVDMIYAYPDSQTTFAVTWADNPPVERASRDGADRTLDLARDGALARTQATLTGESRDERDGFPARDFSGRNEGGGILNARMILTGTRLYMLIAAFPAASARSEEDVNRFFDSFSLTSAARND